MKVYQLFENNDWENDVITNDNSSIEDFELKLKGLTHEWDLVTRILISCLHQDFPVDDTAEVIPAKVFNNYKDYVSIDMHSSSGVTRYFVEKNNPKKIAMVRKAITKVQELDKEIDSVKQLINQYYDDHMRQNWKDD